MEKPPSLGLRTRIVIALAVVMSLFIVLTELSISRLTSVAMKRHLDSTTMVEDVDTIAAEIERDVVKLRKLVLFYMLIGAVVAIAISSFAITRQVVRPLGQINNAVERVAQGELETEVPIAGAGELISLGVSFNRMTGTLRTQRDELKARVEQLEQSTANLKEAQDSLIRAARLASVGTLAAGVAHEIGNPLTGVLGLLDALDTEADDQQAIRYRELMRSEIKRIDRIINDLLTYARPTPKPDGIHASCEVEEVFQNVTALLNAQRLFDGVEINGDFHDDTWKAAIPRDELTQVLVNLLLNAAQAMNGKGRIGLEIERIDEWRGHLAVVDREAVRLSITDSGTGISKDDEARIFDPFFTKRSDGQGSGLGLAICQSICDRAGGEIALDRNTKEGTRFVITLLSASESLSST
jgi:two-component system, NtrC family, sensor kinase